MKNKNKDHYYYSLCINVSTKRKSKKIKHYIKSSFPSVINNLFNFSKNTERLK